MFVSGKRFVEPCAIAAVSVVYAFETPYVAVPVRARRHEPTVDSTGPAALLSMWLLHSERLCRPSLGVC
jgi:hypothetical protein